MFVVGGESLIDLVSQPVGADKKLLLSAHAGGSPYNCAIALAKLGNRTGYLCPISTDTFGDMLMGPLDAAGVVSLLGERVAAPTTLAVVTLDARGKASYRFYREADRAFTRDGLIAALPSAIDAFQIGGFCPIIEEDAVVWLDVAAAAAERGALITMDPNVRPTLVEDFASYKARLSRFFDIANLVKLSDEDLAALDAGKSIEDHAAELLGASQLRARGRHYGRTGRACFHPRGRGAFRGLSAAGLRRHGGRRRQPDGGHSHHSRRVEGAFRRGPWRIERGKARRHAAFRFGDCRAQLRPIRAAIRRRGPNSTRRSRARAFSNRQTGYRFPVRKRAYSRTLNTVPVSAGA